MRTQILQLLSAFALVAPALAQRADVTRATLDNGLRIVVVRDPLAPVATLMENYLVGANEVPAVLQVWRTRKSIWRFAAALG